MKKILIVIVFLVALVLAPYLTGYIGEKRFSELDSGSSFSNSGFGKISGVDYYRKYITSKVSFNWEAPDSFLWLFPQPIILNCDVVHGVLKIDYECRTQNFFSTVQNLNVEEFFVINGEQSFWKGNKTVLRLNSFPYGGSDNQFLGGHIEISSAQSTKSNSIIIDGNMSGLSFQYGSSRYDLGESTLSGEMNFDQYPIPIGRILLDMQSVEAVSPVNEFRSNGLRVSLSSFEVNDTISAAFNLSIEKIAQGEEGAIDEGGLRFKKKVTGIQADKLLRAINAFKRIKNSKAGALTDGAQTTNAGITDITDFFENILYKGLRIKNELSFLIDKEEYYVNSKFAVSRNLNIMGNLYNTNAFLRAFVFNFSARLPSEIMYLNKRGSSLFEKMNFFVSDEGALTTDITVQSGRVFINEENVSFDELRKRFSAH